VQDEWTPLPEVRFLSRCGIYCGACYIVCASRDGGELLEYVSRLTETPREQIRCGGCLGLEAELWKNCRECETRACLKAKGLQFCYECAKMEQDCERYARKAAGCLARGEDIRESMRRLRSGEAAAWLKEQDAKWRCPACHRSISWYEEKCHHCGNDLRS
jgi:hypothetical protein